jgi:predicted PurR-regulated permease PerM
MFGIDARAARAAWTVFLVAALVGMAYLSRETLFVLVLAIFMAYLIYPAVNLLQRYAPRLPRALAVAAVFLALLIVIAGASISIGQRIGEQATTLSEKLPAVLKDPGLTERIPLPQWMEPLRARIVQTLREQLGGGSDQAMSLVRRISIGAIRFVGNLVYLVVIPILAFLLVKDAPRLRDGAMALITPGPRRAMWEALLDDLNELLGRYVRALLLLSLAAFCAYSVVFSLLGVPYALVIAAIAGPLEFIPVLGPLAAAGVAVLVAAFSGYPHLLWIVLFLIAYRLFQDYVLSPYLMSEGVEVHPVLVIVGILAGEQIGGVPGMFLAIPILAAAKLLIARLPVLPAPTRTTARPIMKPTDPS